MGSTCASVHILWRGSVGDAAKAISRAYIKQGYERAKKLPPAGGKHVILLARDGERYISIYALREIPKRSGTNITNA